MEAGRPYSTVYLYGLLEEYDDILSYCLPYGKAFWPLLFDQVAKGNRNVYCLLRDLTAGGYDLFLGGVTQYVKPPEKSQPDLIYMAAYCKILLTYDYDNILKAVQNISIPKN